MPEKTSKKKTKKRKPSSKAVRKVFSESEVGALIEDLEHKMDLLLEGFSAQSSRMDRIEEIVFQMGQKILIIEDKLMLIEDKLLRSEENIRRIEELQLRSGENMRQIEEKLLRIESAVAALTEVVTTNTADIQILKSKA